ncbi:hypothetical protein SLEP1_g42458 [Rubroshorea leprosula]|uniref:Secreted protein n=1 Tax=Rubroshorea leprosula TaxID=152421 RepID=A0AAV5L9X2_9ROSI|nr:hypothetical protein SLEP1_g42458 [Rubroshorea leprosula]
MCSISCFCSSFLPPAPTHLPLRKPNFRICPALLCPSTSCSCLWVRNSLIFRFADFPLHCCRLLPSTRSGFACWKIVGF